MVSFPFCKINLGLQIVNKRPDGYHNLVTCFYPIPWTDVLEIIPSGDFSFQVSGIPIDAKAEDNLCIRAYNLMKEDHHLPPIEMYLHKIIPMGAGLGGGSSDAAFTLRLLNEIFNLKLQTKQLVAYASRLGSDCSFFVQDGPMLGEGRGELLSPISVSLAGKFMVLVKPSIHVSTSEAYSGVSPKMPENNLKVVLENTSISSWKDLVKNDFEESVFKKYPAIERIKNDLYALGADYSSMSGSGSTVFGIFSKPIKIENRFADAICFSKEL